MIDKIISPIDIEDLIERVNEVIRALNNIEVQKPEHNKQMVAALDDIQAIVFGRGDSVTKVNKVKDRITHLNTVERSK